MRTLIKFITRILVFLTIFIVLAGVGIYYSEQPRDYMALGCVVVKGQGNKNPVFMIRKKPFESEVEGLYVAPNRNPKFSKNDKITDLYKVSNEIYTDKDWIVFKNSGSKSKLYVRLGRQTLNIDIGLFIEGFYNIDPNEPIKIYKSLKCNEIPVKSFYDTIRPVFEQEVAKFKI